VAGRSPSYIQTFHMKTIIAGSVVALVAVALLLGQRQKIEVFAHPQLEVLSVFPPESPPGQFQQVEQRRLETLSDQGWELVSVMPYVYRNEERNIGEMRGPKPVVTQTYPAYFFKRLKAVR
jgi:hypothetical protein